VSRSHEATPAPTTPLDVMGALPRWFTGASWAAWRTLLATLFAVPLTAEQMPLFKRCTGRTRPPAEPAREGWLIVGRRGGKSLIAALVAVWAAVFRTYHLAPGERGLVMVIAADRRQARVVLRYIAAILETLDAATPLILIEHRTAEAIHLGNGISIEVHTASFRSVRGYTVIAAICDEIAVWPAEDSANPDEEILAALRPAMATVPGALLLCISSPYARRGALWEAHRRHFGQDDDPVLVWQADTRTMNPTVPEHVITEAYERDPATAMAEYGAEFRRDVEAFVPREVLDACVIPGRFALPPVAGTVHVGATDVAGGSGADEFATAVAHAEMREGRIVVVLDAVTAARAPFSPAAVTEEHAAFLLSYGVRVVTGDRYGGTWPAERFREHAIEYVPATRAKSDVYREVLPLLTSACAELLDHHKLVAQFLGLEHRTARGGRESIDHAPGGRSHDDLANAAALALVRAAELASAPPDDGDWERELDGKLPEDEWEPLDRADAMRAHRAAGEGVL
jgi:hypothetical protein